MQTILSLSLSWGLLFLGCLFVFFCFFGGVQISQHIPITPIVVPTKTLSTILVWPSGIHQKQYM
jgi:hypothetical protein